MGETWKIVMYRDADGHCPVRTWLDGLEPPLQAAAIAAIEMELAQDGTGVCRTQFGKNLGDGIYELRIAQDAPTIARRRGRDPADTASAEVLLRVFFATDGAKIILLLSGYGKMADSKPRRQNKEIERAKRYLRSYRLEQRRLKKGRER